MAQSHRRLRAAPSMIQANNPGPMPEDWKKWDPIAEARKAERQRAAELRWESAKTSSLPIGSDPDIGRRSKRATEGIQPGHSLSLEWRSDLSSEVDKTEEIQKLLAQRETAPWEKVNPHDNVSLKQGRRGVMGAEANASRIRFDG